MLNFGSVGVDVNEKESKAWKHYMCNSCIINISIFNYLNIHPEEFSKSLWDLIWFQVNLFKTDLFCIWT